MGLTLFRLVCRKGHPSNAVIWEGQSVEEYVRGKRCNSCCSELERAGARRPGAASQD